MPGGWPASQAAIPAAWLTLYQQAAATCPGLPWSVLAAIGTVETGQRPVRRLRGCGPGPTAPGPKGRCSSNRPPSPPTPPSDPVVPDPPPPTTRSTPSTPRPPCCAPTVPGPPSSLRARHRRLQPLRHLRGHRADPGPRLPTEPGHLGHGGGRPVLRRPAAQRPLPLGWHRHRRLRLLRTGPGSPSPTPGSPSPGWPRTSSTPAPRSPPDRRSNPGTWCSSGAGPSAVDHVGHLRRGGRDDRRPPHRRGGAVRRRRLAGSGGGHQPGVGGSRHGSTRGQGGPGQDVTLRVASDGTV